MKIGIISDIHAHLTPLKRAVALFESQNVDQILCAGDLVDGGWEDEAVIDIVRSYNIVSVRGNHDREAYADPVDLWELEDDVNGDLGDLRNAYRAEYLNSLPLTRKFEWNGLRVFLTHGTPWSDTYHVFPNVSADVCRRILNETKADIVVLGHTHIPMKLQIGDKWILNPGALCGNRDDLKRTCGILELPQAQFDLFDVDTQKLVELKTRTIDITFW